MNFTTITQPVLQGFYLKTTHLLEQTIKERGLKRFFQYQQFSTGLNLCSKAFQLYKIPVSFNLGYTGLLFAFLPRICASVQESSHGNNNSGVKAGAWLDRQWNKISDGSYLASAAASVALIAGGERAFGAIVLGMMALGELESRKMIPIALTRCFTVAAQALNFFVLAATVYAGSSFHVVLLTYIVGNQILDYVGHTYYPFNEKIAPDAESKLVAAMRDKQWPETPRVGVLSNEHMQWRAIPRFFTIQFPTELKYVFKPLSGWLLNQANEGNVIPNEMMQTLEKTHSSLILLCKTYYLISKKALIDPTAPGPSSKLIDDIEKLEKERSECINRIKAKFEGESLVSFEKSLEIDGFHSSEFEIVKTAVNNLKTSFRDFITRYQFDISKEQKAFAKLSLLGLLQTMRMHVIEKQLNPMNMMTKEEVKQLIECFFSKKYGLQTHSDVQLPYLSGLILNRNLTSNIYDCDDQILFTKITNYLKELPFFEKDETKADEDAMKIMELIGLIN